MSPANRVGEMQNGDDSATILYLSDHLSVLQLYDEQDLMRRVAAGDEQAFRQLFHAYHQQLGAFVLGWTKSLPATEEIVQDAFLKVWINREALAGVEKFGSYLYVLARNHTFNSLRQMARERTRSKEWQDWQEGAGEAEGFPETAYQLVEAAAARLPLQQQKVYQLKSRQGLKYDEIAAELGISPETARKHFAAA